MLLQGDQRLTREGEENPIKKKEISRFMQIPRGGTQTGAVNEPDDGTFILLFVIYKDTQTATPLQHNSIKFAL